MSLRRLMLRGATVAALKGKTIAQERVFDSMMSPLQTSKPDDMLPSVCVYTEADTGTNINENDAHPLLDRHIDIQLEITIGSWTEMTVPGPQGNPEQVNAYIIAATDPELEALLDLFEMQIRLTLFGTSNEALFLQGMVRKWMGWNTIPGRDDNGNNKLCARQLLIPTQVNDDCLLPVDGRVIAVGAPGRTIYPPIEQVAPYLQNLLIEMAKTPAYASMRDMLQVLWGTKPLPPVSRLNHLGFNVDASGDRIPDVSAPINLTE